MLITKATEYAILGLINLAKHPGVRLKVVDIAQAEKISPAFLGKIFQKLSKAKIINPGFGPTGGFSLNKKASGINLQQIILAVSGGEMVACLKYKPKHCQRPECKLQKVLIGGQRKAAEYFQKITLKQLIN